MCGNATCPLAWREKLNLRMLCNELDEQNEFGLAKLNLPAADLIYDVCTAVSIDPYDVLPASIIANIRATENNRLWPTLTEAEDAEMIELAGIREPVHSDRFSSLSGADIDEMFKRD